MSEPQPPSGTDDRLLAGLAAIIDATAGILAAESLRATLQAMADALHAIVPYTSLAVYEVDWAERVCVPLTATGSYVEQTLRSRAVLGESITGSAVLTGRVVQHGPDDLMRGGYQIPGTPENEAESILVVPLRVDGRVQGTLNIWRESRDAAFRDEVRFRPEEEQLIERFATLAAIAYANSTQRERLRALALTDELTGLYNRRHCETALRAALEDGRRHDEPTSVAYFDLDSFKAINDGYGHGSGDETLRDFATVLRAQTRAGDIACRTGGEEFTVVLPRTARDEAGALATRINAAVRAARLGPRADLTVSAGVATAERSRGEQESLIRSADAALLAAKRGGRDRVVLAPPSG